VIAAYDAPWDLIRSRTMESAFSRYCFANMAASLEVRATSPVYLNGAVAVVWAPYMTVVEATAIYHNNPRSWSLARHAMLYAGKNNGVTLEVPFIGPHTHLDLRTNTAQNTIGCYLVVVLNPILFGAGATNTTVTLSVFASFSACDFAVINPTSVSIVPQGGVVSGIKKATNVAGAVLEGVDRAVGAVDQFAGSLDYPNISTNPIPLQPRQYAEIAHTEGVSYSYVLGENGIGRPLVTPAKTTSPDDEMSLRYLTQRLTYFTNFTVSTLSPFGQAVYVGDICPGSELFTLPLSTVFVPHSLTYVSLPFSFWKGGIRVKFVAVANDYQVAKFQICSHVAYESAGLDINEAFGQYTATWDVCGVSEITIDFPFRSTTEWKRVNNGSPASARDYSMGQFSVRVLNPPSNIDQVSNTFYVNVYMGGADDYELAFLGNNAIDFNPVEPAPSLTSLVRKQPPRRPKNRNRTAGVKR